MANPNEPTLTSTDQVILSRLTRMAGIPEDLRTKITLFKQKFIASTNEIINQRKTLEGYINLYREKSKNCTIYKTQIQKLQINLESVLQEIEDLKFNSADVLAIQDEIEEKQKMVDQLNHLLEEAISAKEKAENVRKNKIQDIEKVKQQHATLKECLDQEWNKHSELTKQLADSETQAQQLRNMNEERQRTISTMEANAEIFQEFYKKVI